MLNLNFSHASDVNSRNFTHRWKYKLVYFMFFISSRLQFLLCFLTAFSQLFACKLNKRHSNQKSINFPFTKAFLNSVREYRRFIVKIGKTVCKKSGRQNFQRPDFSLEYNLFCFLLAIWSPRFLTARCTCLHIDGFLIKSEIKHSALFT